jgi:ABC-type sugar transport system substrate-binding protein
MRGWVMRQGLIAGFLIASAVLAGCDSDSFAPPPTTGKSRSPSSTSGAMPVRATEVVMILPAAENGDLALYDLVGRNEAGMLKVVYRGLKPSPGEAPSRQAELIKQAAAEGASALVVVPEASKETADALAALDPKKTPVVLLGRSPSGGAPASLTQVSFQGFDVSAKGLVDTILEAEKVFGIKPDAPALFLTVTPTDETTAERDAALVAALKAAKIPLFATVPVTNDSASAEKAVLAAVKDHPEIGVVVCGDEAALSAANAIRREYPARMFTVAGYFAGRNNAATLMMGNVAALAERSIETLVRRAMRIAVDRADGKEAPAKVVVDIPLRRGSKTALKPGTAPGGSSAGPPTIAPSIRRNTPMPNPATVAPPDAETKKAATPEAKKGP